MASKSAGRPVRPGASNVEDGNTKPRGAAHAPAFPDSEKSKWNGRASASRRLSIAEAHLRSARRRYHATHADDRDGSGIEWQKNGESDRCRQADRAEGERCGRHE